MKKNVLAWAIPALMFVATGFLALLKGPSVRESADRSYGLFVDYGSSTVGCSYCGCNSKTSGSLFGSIMGGGSSMNGTGNFCRLSKYPTNYYTGEKLYSTADLEAPGFEGLNHSRYWATDTSYVDGLMGPGWKSGVPRLVQKGSKVVLVNASRHARSWTVSGSAFLPDSSYFYKETLNLTADTLYIHLSDEDGYRMGFVSFNHPTPQYRGRLLWTMTPQGNNAGTGLTTGLTEYFYHPVNGTTNGELSYIDQYERVNNVWEGTAATRMVFAYDFAVPNRLVTVTLNKWSGGAFVPQRYVLYDYYGSSPNGPAGALERAIVYQSSDGSPLETKYYRYDAGGVVKQIIEGEAYERLKAALGGTDAAVDAASDLTTENYANYKLVFDGNQRLTSERVLGVGTIVFSVPSMESGHPIGHNNWKRKTVETMPNSDQNIVYTNAHGAAVLSIVREASTGKEWKTWYLRDANGRVIWEATPSAVTGYSESNPTLVDANGVAPYDHIADSAGLIEVTEYASSTTATSGTPGDVQGYVKARYVKQGETGTQVKTEQNAYIARSGTYVFSATVYALASRTQYRNTDGTGGQTTSYAYTWQAPGGIASNAIQSVTTTHPIVTTAQNGSNAATSRVQFLDQWQKPTWLKDEDGFIHVTRYDRGTGATSQQIRDVATGSVSDEPAGWVTPAGAGLHLTWNYEFDFLARTTRVQDPDTRLTYTIYKDANWEVRTYPGWTGTATTGPTRVVRRDKPGSYTEVFTTSVTPTSSASRPTGAEVLNGTSLTSSTLHSLERSFRDAFGHTTHVDSYFTFSGLTYTTGTTLGTQGTHTTTTNTHFHRRSFTYDANGRQEKDTDWTGTIRKSVWDGADRVATQWIGTSDANLIKTQEFIYDGGGTGNGNITSSKFFTAAATSLDTVSQYDFRDRMTDTRSPANVAVKRTYDNLNQVTLEDTYASADFTYAAAELRGKRETKFDEKGQAYQTIVHHVNPSTGAVGNRLTSTLWSNARGMNIKTRGPNGEFRKTAYDGAGRTTASFVSYHDAETSYADADDVASDTVIDQSVHAYSAAGDLNQTTRYERTNSTAKAGDLSASWAEADSRRSYSASWYDNAHRITSFVDYGRNNGSTFTRPGSAPAPNTSDLYIVTAFAYNTGGRQYRLTDNKARIRELTFDMLSRTTKTVENYVNGAVAETELDTDRTTETIYDGAGRLSILRAKNPKGTGAGVEDQNTTYVYGTDANVASPPVRRNDVLVAEIYPDSDDTYNPGGSAGAKLGNGTDTTYDRVEYTYDYASRKLTWKLQDTTTHTYAYDSVGRLFTDAATTLGSGIDGAVRRLEHAYDDLSRKLTVSSYSATSAGTLLNQVRFTYDGWGNELACTQGHEGTATGAPGYTKAFVDGAVSGEAKYVRLASMTYPNSRVVYRNYPAAATVGDKLSRVDNVANDASGTTKFSQYTYLGQGAIVKIAHPAVTGGFNLDLGTGTGNPAGWDNFGRIDDQKWQNDAASIKDQYQYGYDRMSNRTFRDNLTATAKDHFYPYDGLDRLTTAKRGDLNAGRTDITGTPAFQETWTLESLGNWRQLVQTTAGTATLNQTRTHTKANETTTINATVGTNWGDGVLDRNGNMTRVPTATPNQLWRLTYDAWNRLVQVVDDVSPNPVIAKYKYDAMHRRIVKLKPNGANWDRRDYYYSCEWQVVEERELLNTASQTTVATVPKFQWLWDIRYIDAVLLRDENKNGDGDCTDAGPTDQRLYYAQDANFNTTALLDTSGTVVERVLYDAYGKHTLYQSNWTTVQASTVYNNEVLYAGYRLNPESGMYQVRHREYHPILARWTTRDPAGYIDSLSLYEYCRTQPIQLSDPSGLDPKKCGDQWMQTGFYSQDLYRPKEGDPTEKFLAWGWAWANVAAGANWDAKIKANKKCWALGCGEAEVKGALVRFIESNMRDGRVRLTGSVNTLAKCPCPGEPEKPDKPDPPLFVPRFSILPPILWELLTTGLWPEPPHIDG